MKVVNVVEDFFKGIFDFLVDLIINLQGDMPNIKPNSISKLEKLMRQKVMSNTIRKIMMICTSCII